MLSYNRELAGHGRPSSSWGISSKQNRKGGDKMEKNIKSVTEKSERSCCRLVGMLKNLKLNERKNLEESWWRMSY